MDKREAYLICHTHWDREWYLTREQFKPKLVRLFDTILDVIEKTDEYIHFMLDGQVIVLEDYLEIRPQNKQKIIDAVQNKRMSIGPWYVLPDEMLISGESHIRNYLIGDLICKEYGSKMDQGYLPDSFGHPEQMPQILKGLGMDTIVFWRGTANFMDKSEFYWESPLKKKKVLSIHMPFGYGNVARLEKSSVDTFKRLDDIIENLHNCSTSEKVLLMNGSDHILIEQNILGIIKDYNKNSEKNVIKMASLDDFINDKKANLSNIKTYSGELRYGDRSMLLGCTTSARVYLKQKNILAQKLMERYIEPLASCNWFLNKIDFNDMKNYIWKNILENHPHDSICGCSIDEVHKEMEMRFNNIFQLENTVLDDLSKTISEYYTSNSITKKVQLICFSPSQTNNFCYVEKEIDFDTILVNKVNYAKSIIDDYEDGIDMPELPTGIKGYDRNGNEIKTILLSAKTDYYMHMLDESAPVVYKVNRCRVGIYIPFSEYGYHMIYLEKSNVKNNEPYKSSGNKIENKFYQVVYNKNNSTFTIKDKKNNKVYENACTIIDKGDSGDEYTYSWPETDREFIFEDHQAKFEVIKCDRIYEKLIINGVFKLPKSLADDRKSRCDELISNNISIIVTLFKDSNKIDFKIDFHNESKDHILQVEIPSGVLDDFNYSSTAFALTKHKTEITVPEDYMEYPLPINVTHGFINVSSDIGGVSVATNSLMEYETINKENESRIRLTLMRSVGWLSRPDLLTRKGNGGWSLETPEAQCLGDYSFEFALMYLASREGMLSTYSIADSYLHKPHISQIKIPNKSISIKENILAFVSSLPEEIRLSAIKPSENGEGIILRVFNISENNVEVSLIVPTSTKSVDEVTLSEINVNSLEINNNSISFCVEGYEIKNLFIK